MNVYYKLFCYRDRKINCAENIYQWQATYSPLSEYCQLLNEHSVDPVYLSPLSNGKIIFFNKDRRAHDRLVVGITTTSCEISAYHH